MRIVICDDDKLFTEQLEDLIREYFHSQCIIPPDISSFSDGESLLSDTGDKNLLFLDIQMPGRNGVNIGNEIKRKHQKTIIFIITSFPEYLDETMRFQVFRYLPKPLEKERFFRNLKDALHSYYTFSAKIPVETKNRVITLHSSDIIMVEAKEREVLVYTSSEQYNSIHNIQYWVCLLPKNIFFQTHRSYLVNFEHVSDFNRSLIYLNNRQYNAYLTRRKYTDFKTAYFLYLETMR